MSGELMQESMEQQAIDGEGRMEQQTVDTLADMALEYEGFLLRLEVLEKEVTRLRETQPHFAKVQLKHYPGVTCEKCRQFKSQCICFGGRVC